MSQDVKFVLILNGKGIHSYFNACLLQLIQDEFHINFPHTFDLMVCNDMNSVMLFHACDIYQNEPVNAFNYKDMLSIEIFNQFCKVNMWNNIMKDVQYRPIYDTKQKRKSLGLYIDQNRKLGEIEKDILLCNYNLSKCTSEIFSTYHDNCKNYSILDVINMSTSTPPYYPPVKINEYWYMNDVNDNLALLAYTEAKQKWPNSIIRIMYIGLEYCVNIDNGEIRDWGTIQWVNNGLLNALYSNTSSFKMYKLLNMMKSDNSQNHILMLNDFTQKVQIFDIRRENFNLLQQQSYDLFYSNSSNIENFLNIDYQYKKYSSSYINNFLPDKI